MPEDKVEARVFFDAVTWKRIDVAGARAGLSREQFIDDAVRRALAGQALAALFRTVRERSDLTEAQAEELIAAEKAAARAEGRPAADEESPTSSRR